MGVRIQGKLTCLFCQENVVPIGYMDEDNNFVVVPNLYYCKHCDGPVNNKTVADNRCCAQCGKDYQIRIYDLSIHDGLCGECGKLVKKKSIFDYIQDMTPDQIKIKLRKAGFSEEDIRRLFEKFGIK